MDIVREAQAGTLQSSDVMVMVKPAERRAVLIESTASARFKEQIEKLVNEVLDEMGVDKVEIKIKDQGALPFAMRARIKTALKRASQGGENE